MEKKSVKKLIFTYCENKGILMFNGEKTNLFWVGLVVLGFAFLVLFTAIWQNIVGYLDYLSYSSRYPDSYFSYSSVWSYVPIVVGGIIFLLIGLYMMKSGVKKEEPNISKPADY
jgi:hypothetical protein